MSFNKPQNKTGIIPAVIVLSTAGEAGRPALKRPHPRKLASARSAPVKQTTRATLDRERQDMASCFAADP